MSKSKQSSFVSVGDLCQKYQLDDKGGYITREFQDFGYRLSIELDDSKHRALYIKMAKEEDRALLERALSFVSDARNVKSKAGLFMWKFKQLKKEKLAKQKAQYE